MNNLPWTRPGRFYRGNLHTHSTRSDGMLPPEEVVAAYRDHGYDFLAITDHFMDRYEYPVVDTRDYRTPTFTTLIGAELHAGQIEVGERWHILAVGLPLDFAPPTADEDGPRIAARAAAAGAFVGIAHPAWYGLTVKDALSIEVAHAVEIYNETCLWLNDRPDGWTMCDTLLAGGRRLLAYAADDAHFKERPDWRAAWVHVRAESLAPDALLSGLKAGHFYSSQGPTIDDLRIEDGQLWLACSPAEAIFVGGRGSRRATMQGSGLTETRVPVANFMGDYLRVTVMDANGRRAWTNPIWLD